MNILNIKLIYYVLYIFIYLDASYSYDLYIEFTFAKFNNCYFITWIIISHLGCYEALNIKCKVF